MLVKPQPDIGNQEQKVKEYFAVTNRQVVMWYHECEQSIHAHCGLAIDKNVLALLSARKSFSNEKRTLYT